MTVAFVLERYDSATDLTKNDFVDSWSEDGVGEGRTLLNKMSGQVGFI